MNQTLKKALSGTVYVAIMWFGTSYSEISFTLLFGIILLVCLYEMPPAGLKSTTNLLKP